MKYMERGIKVFWWREFKKKNEKRKWHIMGNVRIILHFITMFDIINWIIFICRKGTGYGTTNTGRTNCI